MSVKDFFHRWKEAKWAGLDLEHYHYQARLQNLGLPSNPDNFTPSETPVQIAAKIANLSRRVEKFTKLQKKRFEFSRKTAHAGMSGELFVKIMASGKTGSDKHSKEISRICFEKEKFDIYRRAAFGVRSFLAKADIKQQMKSAQKQKMKI